MTRSALCFLISLIVLALPAPSHARQAEELQDWTLTRIEDREATVATIDFTPGLDLVARCVDGVYDLFILDLPEAPRDALTRELGVSIGEGGDVRTTVWTVGDDRTTAFSRIPAMVARQLADGGKLQIVVPASGDQRRTRYVLNLDPSSSALEETLTACGRPLVDPRRQEVEGNGQDGLPAGAAWARAPRPHFPRPVEGRSPTVGYVVMSCVAQASGELSECQIESEQPAGYRLGEAVEKSLDRARVELTPAGVASGKSLDQRLIIFTVNFMMRR